MSRENRQTAGQEPKPRTFAEWFKPIGTGVGLLVFMAGAMKLLAGLSGAPGAESHLQFITGAVLLGGAAGIIGMAWGWFDPTPPQAAMKPGLFYGAGLAVTVFIGLFILRCGMHQIGGYDHGILVDFGWRLFKGQRAYVDFPCTVPVAFPLGVKFAFQWFGVYWRSVIVMTALFAMGTFAWSLFLLAQLFGRGCTTLLWAMTVQAFSLMLASFWWYSPITAVAAVLYTLSALYWLRRPADKMALASYGAALLLMATMKANVAGVLILGCSVILFVSPNHRWKTLWVSFGSLALFLVLMSLNHLSFFGMLAAYRSISTRGASLVPFLIGMNPREQRLAMVMVATLVLPVVVALSQGRRSLRSVRVWIPAAAMAGGTCFFMAHLDPVIYGQPGWRKTVGAASLVLPVVMAFYPGRQSLRSPGPWIGVVAMLGGLYGCLTNSEQKLIDLPPVLVAGIVLVAELRCPVPPKEGPVFQMPLRWNRYFSLVCVVLGMAGLAQGFARDRIESIGPLQFFQYDDSKHTIASGFFKGVHCGDIFDEMLKEITEVLRREPSSTLWFGPRMQWAYAAFDKPSPLNEPVIWDRLTMFDKSKEELYFNHFLQSRWQVLILFKNDISGYTQEEVQRISQQYEMDQSFPLLTILRLKK